MRYISLFSGIEAASVAWEVLRFKPVAFSEIDPFCSQLLKIRFPNVPNLGDISDIDWSSYYGKVDIVVGGSPCQAFSVAGPRTGLLDERSALMLEYVRAVREIKPTWCLWENVPGVLSQDGGRAFATLQRELENCGYAMAWRVLDAQFFGVAQRRRRVFLVGHSDPRCATAVLFERESLLRDFATSRKARAGFASAAQKCAGNTSESSRLTTNSAASVSREKKVSSICEGSSNQTCYSLVGNIIGRKPENGGNGNGYQTEEEPMYTLTATDCHAVCQVKNTEDERVTPTLILDDQDGACMNVTYDVAPTLRANTQGHEPIVMSSGQAGAVALDGLCPTQTARQYKDPPILFESYAASSFAGFNEGEVGTLTASGGSLGGGSETLITELSSENKEQSTTASSLSVRRLTPIECERLQGFPDNWTRIAWKGKSEEQCPDSRRYKALGNSMAVPVMEWLGRRIQLANQLSNNQNLMECNE